MLRFVYKCTVEDRTVTITVDEVVQVDHVVAGLVLVQLDVLAEHGGDVIHDIDHYSRLLHALLR